MRKSILCSLLILPLLGQPAFAEQAAPGDAPPVSGVKKTMAKVMLDNESFVKKATISNLAEIELSRLALGKTRSADIQQFAQRMIKDHMAASDKLRAIARTKNIAVPDAPDAAHKEVAEKMAKLEGADFDREFSQQMQKDHDMAVTLFAAAAEDKSLDPEFKQLAAQLLPTLQQHQHAAHGLEAGKAAASRNEPGSLRSDQPATMERP